MSTAVRSPLTSTLDPPNAELVERAAAGEAAAWEQLVERYSALLWSVTRAYRLAESDAADVVQTAWMRLVEHLGDLRDPERVGSWLAATVRHECLRVLGRGKRELPVDEEFTLPDLRTPEMDVLAGVTAELLWEAVATLPEPSRRLLRVLLADPAPSYAEASRALGIPIGSIGPTRGRALARLKVALAAMGVTAA
jgi:RNA polymerase sigma factor (sigma-70 family)